MKKEKKNKKRNRIILISIVLIYLSVLGYLILNVEKPGSMIVTTDADSVVMDGLAKVNITVQILNDNGNPMSGQKIYYQYMQGSGKVTVIRSITSENGISLGVYTSGYGNEEQEAKILIENESGLSKIISIEEYPSLVSPGKVIIEADTQSNEILTKGLLITATLLDTNGNPMKNHNLLFKVDKGNGGFLGFRLMTKSTDEDGKASYKFETTTTGNVVITVESEEDRSVSATISFSVK